MPKYLFTYSPSMGDKEAVKSMLNSISEITDWRYDLPNCFFLETNLSAKDLSRIIRNKHADGRYFITEISHDNRQGMLPRSTWDFLRKIEVPLAHPIEKDDSRPRS